MAFSITVPDNTLKEILGGMVMNPASNVIMVSSLAMLVAVSGCSTLPKAGADSRDVEKSAAVRVGLKDQKVGIDYVLLDVNSYALPFFKTAETKSLLSGIGGKSSGAPEAVIGIGDIVQVSIFESSSGGLFIPSDAGSRAGNFVTLPQQTVDRDGSIAVPYAGKIKAAGRTAQSVQAEIETLLANRAIEPQAVVSLITNQSRQMSVLGDVNAPAKLEINPSGERILDVIARAGGLSSNGVETTVTLQRRGKEGTIRFSDLIKDSKENIYVAGGDTIYVNRERRTYLAFGASGLNGRIDFDESDLTLGEALGKAGGLLDSRADPKQVLLYREVERSTLKRMNVDVSRFKGDAIPVIFRANMRDPSALFAVQKFAMADKDVLYVSNSDSTEVQKFVSIVTSVTGGIATPPEDALSVRNAIRGF